MYSELGLDRPSNRKDMQTSDKNEICSTPKEVMRKDKEIKDKIVIESIIKKATVCRIALSENNIPYIVPLCFGYKDNCLYFPVLRKAKNRCDLKK